MMLFPGNLLALDLHNLVRQSIHMASILQEFLLPFLAESGRVHL